MRAPSWLGLISIVAGCGGQVASELGDPSDAGTLDASTSQPPPKPVPPLDKHQQCRPGLINLNTWAKGFNTCVVTPELRCSDSRVCCAYECIDACEPSIQFGYCLEIGPLCVEPAHCLEGGVFRYLGPDAGGTGDAGPAEEP
jgi:hypothetical protein